MHDVVGAVRQEQIVQYIQHISPVHTTNGGRGQCTSSDKSVGAFAPMAPGVPTQLCIQHTVQLHA